MKTVTIYTDGACSGNPGPGGWACILSCDGVEKEASGGEVNTTNNRMELTAVVEALSLLKQSCVVELYSDSRYVIDGLSKCSYILGPNGGMRCSLSSPGSKPEVFPFTFITASSFTTCLCGF